MGGLYTHHLLGEPYVYPGHALIVAYVIMHVFQDIDSALKKTDRNWPAAVAHIDVPGAGDGAYAGAHAITLLRDGKTPDQVVEWAQDEWCRRVGPGTGNLEDRFQPGYEQAERFVDKFLDKARAWVQR